MSDNLLNTCDMTGKIVGEFLDLFPVSARAVCHALDEYLAELGVTNKMLLQSHVLCQLLQCNPALLAYWLTKKKTNQLPLFLERSDLHDLNLPPPPPAAAIGTQAITEDSVALDLRLVSPSSAAPEYQSVCTLEKVKSALERAEREARGRRRMSEGSPSPSSSTTSSSAKRRAAEEEDGLDGWDSSVEMGMMAAGCPGCLLYVLISRRNPRCPRCDSHVPITAMPKKPKIDLNSTSP